MAPMEGLTDFTYRNAYEKTFGKGRITKYFTPFIPAAKKMSKKMKKRKNYYFCGFIFALFTIGFLLLGISALLRVAMLTYVAAILFVLIAIATIAFSIYTESN